MPACNKVVGQARLSPKVLELFDTVKDVAKGLNLPLKERFRSVVSDANFIAHQNIPVIDGLGPIGGKDHSQDEYMIKESLLQRTAFLACSFEKCWKIFETNRQ